MKITKKQLKQIIKEELEQVLDEFDLGRTLKKGALALTAPAGIDAENPAYRIDNYAFLSQAYEAMREGDAAALQELMSEVHLLWDQYQAGTATIEEETADFVQQVISKYENLKQEGSLGANDLEELDVAYEAWAGPVAKLGVRPLGSARRMRGLQ